MSPRWIRAGILGIGGLVALWVAVFVLGAPDEEQVERSGQVASITADQVCLVPDGGQDCYSLSLDEAASISVGECVVLQVNEVADVASTIEQIDCAQGSGQPDTPTTTPSTDPSTTDDPGSTSTTAP